MKNIVYFYSLPFLPLTCFFYMLIQRETHSHLLQYSDCKVQNSDSIIPNFTFPTFFYHYTSVFLGVSCSYREQMGQFVQHIPTVWKYIFLIFFFFLRTQHIALFRESLIDYSYIVIQLFTIVQRRITVDHLCCIIIIINISILTSQHTNGPLNKILQG